MKVRAIGHALTQPGILRLLPWLLLVVVALLIAKQSAAVDWPAVAGAIRSYQLGDIVTAFALAGTTYLIYSCFDLLGRHYVGSSVSVIRVMRTAFISYAINQSVGSLVGGVAFRFRLYSQLGVDATKIAKIILISVVTNWFGYSVIAGSLFVCGVLSIPGWDSSRLVLQIVGGLLLGAACAYLVFCARHGGRELTIWRYALNVPTIGLALWQLLLSVLHWPTAAAILFFLCDGALPYPSVLAALLLSAIAALLLHIPAGIGVLEGVFIALFRARVPLDALLAALLVFRAVYHLAPLTVAMSTYLLLEIHSAPHARESKSGAPTKPSPT